MGSKPGNIDAYLTGVRMLVAFGAAANHCAFYPMSGTTVGVRRG